MVRDLRRARDEYENFPAVLFVFQGIPAQGEAFFERFWPGARGVADPARGLYAAFSLQRGAIGKYLAPGVALAGMRAMLRGNGVGKPVGDVRTMPGLYLVEGTQVRWAQSFDHIGQRPDLRGVLAALRADRAE